MREEQTKLQAEWDKVWSLIEQAHKANDFERFAELNKQRKVIQHQMCEVTRAEMRKGQKRP